MATNQHNPIPAEVMADLQAVSDAVAAGKAVDPEIARRVRNYFKNSALQ